ncbi:entericidin A/B family lipoprotein [Pseudooceanicola sp. CBS1P-1]|uniref:Entericidin A/B family lipoprotein n=1 Tax=Pseudooceanicola albus TaxID=2692189 RepID=A0A6L7G7Y1_9RHOB|nr:MULTISPECIES: entericidin A/B family lipoprotein [Pseudooceanicola]MBT9382941.1 entericidin A/B family lipoprotein [Pseudooceanicola endophyticus]MXN20135.1 entericidin A/B family lipoprotein [Pseudooceanicola albus]
MLRIAALTAALLSLAACETIHGAGQDIQNAGEGIQQSATETQAQM